MNLIKDFKNDLLKRREVKLIITAEKNPGIASASQKIAEELKVNEDVIAIKTLKSKFGRDTFLIDAFIYNSVKDKETIEPRKKLKKGEVQQPAPAPAAAKEVKK